MAYGLKYQIPFLSSKNETFLINLLLKDYTGITTNLEGAPDPFLVAWESGDNDIINPIRASECTVNFYNNGSTPLTAFYSEDDEAWKIEFYRQTGNKLLWSGFLVQDDCRETFQDPPHIVSLKGTDNLALLKDVPFNEAWFAEPLLDKTNILDKYSLFDFIKYSLLKTGLQLPLNIYSNIYENSMPDRADDTANDMFRQTLFYSGMFLNDDGTWANCYEILEKILFPLNATLQQAGGAWQIVRWPELRMFSGNAIPGSAYDANFDILSAVTLAPNAVLAHGGVIEFINADATKSILRPYKNVKFTFNYEQPKGLIYGSDLRQTGAFIGSSPDTIDGIVYRYDDYQLPIQWRHADGDTSYIRIVTDTSTDPETEKERYIITPGSNVETRGVRFNDIEVSTGDSFDLTLNFRLPQDVSDDVWVFAIKFYLQTINGDFYNLAPNLVGDVIDPLLWVKNWNADHTYTISVKKDTDSSQWMDWSLEHYLSSLEGKKIPLIPEDGVLVITVTADNYSTSAGGHTSYWKDIELRFLNFINQSTQIIGQTHNTSIVPNIKNKLEQEIDIDDSPRSPIAGTLFTHQLIDFGGDIGEKYFIKTKAWHRSGITETRRLSEITTMEREQMQSVPRAIIEGTIDSANPLISIMNVMQIDTLPGLNFIFGVTEINFMEGQFKATLWEIHSGETDATMAYTFEYIYKIS